MSNKEGMTSKRVGIACALLILGVLFPSIAFAYVDPASGSIIVTTILGFIVAVGYTFRKYFYKIKRAMLGKKTEEKTNADNSET